MKKPSGSRATKPSKSAWSMRSRFSATSISVYCGAAPTCMATSLPTQSRSMSTVEILENADVEIGGDLLVLRDDLGVGDIQKVVADHLAEMFVARGDHEGG